MLENSISTKILEKISTNLHLINIFEKVLFLKNL